MTRTDGHLLRNRQAEVGARFDAYAAVFDPTTFRHMQGFGIGSGWRCWEVGAGGTSVISWLAKKVGPTGRVLATDIDTSWMAPAARPPVEVRVHDVGRDEPPAEGFDLVHARLVLVHVRHGERALRSMIKALRPGGRLLVEDADPALQPLVCPEEYGPAQQLANRLTQGFRTLLARTWRRSRIRPQTASTAPRGRAARRTGRRVLPGRLARLRRPGVRDDPTDPRPARRRRHRHRSGHRPAPRECSLRQHGPCHGTDDLRVGEEGVDGQRKLTCRYVAPGSRMRGRSIARAL